ncbi:PadR family transcriptional regulator [Umezawaea endophytica]|uniref:PadR family transcriptional regulator n=1 Tax=Umezawaea endophytica TaxID=1654476 RepID=A0A9X3A0I1_9PSEU|nr:PadR family transcriptional regulator [Umezawaea endophytica]MCS7478589.1 PadR family transcriptional regulator [Umezawaea endophytica]
MSTGGYLVLGLLLDGPASGYELGARASRAVAYFWPITRSHIYAELPKLVDRGHATVVVVPQVGAPDKSVYTATEEGRLAFRAWLDGFDDVTEHGRQPLQIQLYFGHHSSREHLLAQLDRWADEVRRMLDFCRNILAEGPSVDPDGGRAVRALTAHFAINRAEADLAWIEEASATVDRTLD